MRIWQLNQDLVSLKLSRFELKIVTNSLEQVILRISTRGFHSRLGVNYEHAKSFLGRIAKLERRLCRQNLRTIEVCLNYDDLLLLNNVFNEVCHGIRIIGFESKIGCERVVVENIFKSFKKSTRSFFDSQDS